MNVTSSQRLLRWLEAVLGANVVILVLNVFTGVLSARLLGPAGKGVYNAAIVWSTVFGSLVVMGLPAALVAAYGTEHDAGQRGRILGSAAFLVALWGSLGAVVGFLLLPELLGHLGGSVVLWARIMMVVLPLGALGQIGMALLRVEHAFGRFSLFRLAQVLLIVVPLTLAAVWGLLTPYVYIGIVLVDNLVYFVVTVVLVRRLLHQRGIALGLGPATLLVSLSKLGFGFYAISLASMFNAQLDQMLASAWLSARDIGLYAVAISSLTVVGALVGAFQSVFFPATVGDERGSIIRRTSQAVRAGWWLLAAVALVLIAGSRPVLGLLYGPSYLPAWPAVVALAPAAVFAGVLTILYQGCYVIRLLDVPLIGEMVGALSGALLLALLIPRWGIVGAGVAGSVSYACDVAVVIHLWRRRLGLNDAFGPTADAARMLVRLGGQEIRSALAFVRQFGERGRTASRSAAGR